jgi:hypothetical protein
MRMLSAVRKMVVANATLTAAVVAGVTLVSFAPAANALSYVTSGAAELFSLGDTLGTASNYDQLQVIGAQGPIGPGTSTITLNKLIFTAGVNAIVPAVYNNIFSFVETMTIGTSSGTLVVPFNLSINYSDTLTIVGGTTLSFLVGANTWNVVVNALTIGPNPGGSEIGYLTAQVSDPPTVTPVPAALLLFATGLGAMGLFGWRRKRRASAAIAP